MSKQLRTAGAVSAVSVLLVLTIAPAAEAQPDRGSSKSGFTAQDPVVDQPGHREWAWEGNNSLSYAGSTGHVSYEPGGSPRIIVTGDPKDVENIEVDGGAIRRRDTPGFYFTYSHPRLEILVRGVTLDHFDVAGSGEMDLGHLQRDTADLHVHGSGAIDAQGQVKHLNLEVNGSGRANLDQLNAGKADIVVNGSGSVITGAIGEGANVHVNGSGRAKFGDVGKNGSIVVTGSSTATLTRVEDLNAEVTGSAIMWLASQPAHADYNVKGSGKVLLRGPDGNVTELASMHRQGRDRDNRD